MRSDSWPKVPVRRDRQADVIVLRALAARAAGHVEEREAA
jgi:hypothetical protein